MWSGLCMLLLCRPVCHLPKTFLIAHVKYVDIKYKLLDKYEKRRQVVPSSIV